MDKGIDLLKANGITPTIVTTIHKLNYTQLPKIRDYLIKKGVRCIYASVCRGGCLRAASVNGGRCNPYCIYHFEQNGFSNEEQARTEFSKEELFMIYDKVRPLPKEYIKK